MQSPLRSQFSGWAAFAGAAGALVAVLMVSGCPGTLDPSMFKNDNGTGGANATGGSGTGGGTGGSSATGGTTGTGGTAASNCTGGNDGVSLLNVNCATSSCHIPGATNDGTAGGLDLTPDSNIGSRLVGVTSVGTANNGSMCMGNSTPYLNANSNPATGLFIDKFTMSHPPCGSQMPFDSPFPLTATQQTCLTQWATTLTSP
jgi:hypothetical protein